MTNTPQASFENCIYLCGLTANCVGVGWLVAGSACYLYQTSVAPGTSFNPGNYGARQLTSSSGLLIKDNLNLIPYNTAAQVNTGGGAYTSLCVPVATQALPFAAFQTVAMQANGASYSGSGNPKFYYEQECGVAFTGSSQITVNNFATLFASNPGGQVYPLSTEQCLLACDYINRMASSYSAGNATSTACVYYQFATTAPITAASCTLYSSVSGYNVASSYTAAPYNSGLWLNYATVYTSGYTILDQGQAGSSYGYRKRSLPAPRPISRIGAGQGTRIARNAAGLEVK